MGSTAELDRLASRVRAAARDGGLIETAQVKLLGLDEVREAAGPRWPRMREQVREGSIRIIGQRIGPDDAVIPCGDGFLVVFADLSPEEMQTRCAEIREALLGFYLGESALNALRADVARETVTAAKLAGLVSETSSRSHVKNQRNTLTLGRFWPVWSVRRQAVAAHLCAPAIETGHQPRLGYAHDFVEKGAHFQRDYLDLDLCLLEQACAAADEPGAAPIGLSVHATTMQSRRLRRIYLEHVIANASASQQRMFVMIGEIEPGTPLISLAEWSNALKHTFPRVALDLHHTDRAIGAIASAGVWAGGFQFPPSRSSGEQLRTWLNTHDAWCKTLRRQSILPFMHGFTDSGFLNLATHSDLAFATAEALWPSADQPVRLQRIARPGPDVQAKSI